MNQIVLPKSKKGLTFLLSNFDQFEPSSVYSVISASLNCISLTPILSGLCKFIPAPGGGYNSPPFDFDVGGLWSGWNFRHMITYIQITIIPNFKTLEMRGSQSSASRKYFLKLLNQLSDFGFKFLYCFVYTLFLANIKKGNNQREKPFKDFFGLIYF